MQRMNKTKNIKEKKIIGNNNPFDDIFFWLSIATADFTFGVFEKEEKSKYEKQTAKDRVNDKNN